MTVEDKNNIDLEEAIRIAAKNYVEKEGEKLIQEAKELNMKVDIPIEETDHYKKFKKMVEEYFENE